MNNIAMDLMKEIKGILSNTLMENMGMEFTGAGEGWLEMQMPVDKRTCRHDGALHGGANLALAETIGGALSVISLPKEKWTSVFGIEINGNHIKSAQGKYVTARAEFIHQGRRTHVVNVEVRDEFGTLVTISRVTNMIVE